MIRAALIFLFGIVASCPCLVMGTTSAAAHAAPREAHHQAAESLPYQAIAQDVCRRIGPASSASGPPVHAVAEHGAWAQHLRETALLSVADHPRFVSPDTARALLQVYRL